MYGSSHSNQQIIQLITGLGLGGAERLVAELALEMDARGRNVCLVALSEDIRILQQYPELTKLTTSLGATKNIFSYVRLFRDLLRRIPNDREIVLHAHMFHALLAATLLKIVRPGIRIIFTSHSYGGFSFYRELFIKLTKRLRHTDIIFAEGQHSRMNARNTQIIPNFAPRITDTQTVAKQRAPGEPFTFAFIGRMVSIKNPLSIIRAFQRLSSPNARLILVGAGPLEDAVKSAIREAGLCDRAAMLGPRNDIQNILSTVDALVLASEWEGLPMVILEAGSRAIPVIAPPVGAIPHLLGKACGYLCTPDELTRVMQCVVSKPDEAKRRGIQLQRKILNKYSIDSATTRHLAIYSQGNQFSQHNI